MGESNGKIVMRAGIVWLKCQRRSIVRQRFIDFALFEQQIGEIGVGVGEIRLKLDSAIVRSDGFINRTFLRKRVTESVISFRMIGIRL